MANDLEKDTIFVEKLSGTKSLRQLKLTLTEMVKAENLKLRHKDISSKHQGFSAVTKTADCKNC